MIAITAGVVLGQRKHNFLKMIVHVADLNRGSPCAELFRCNKALIQTERPMQAGYGVGDSDSIPRELPTMD